MPVFFRATELPVPADEAWAWHQRPGAFERLIAPWQQVEVLRRTGLVEPGAELEMRMVQLGVPVRMVLHHRDLNEPGNLGFIDEQVEGPFAHWHQHHRIVPTGAGACRMEDEIHWEAPVGSALAKGVADAKLEAMFRYRHRRLIADLGHHHPWVEHPRLTFAVSGATGLVGSELATFLSTGGHTIRRMVRREPKPGDIRWDPATGEIDASALGTCDVVIHLAGASIATRWTEAAKREIRSSRVEGTGLLARTLAALPASRRPKVLVSASAVGWYGPRDEAALDERSPGGAGFLAEVADAWERAADPARQAGIRVVHPRIGIVVSGRGGALPPLARVARLGLGGPLGSGDQGISWVAIDDLTAMLHAVALDGAVAGPVNATAPAPVAQREFARALGRVLHRPAFAPVPGAAVRLAAGQMGREMLLEGQKVVPRVLNERGFSFAFPTLDDALAHELGVLPPGR